MQTRLGLRALSVIWGWWSKPATLAIAFHRFGHEAYLRPTSPLRRLKKTTYKLVHPLVEAWSGVTLPAGAQVGRNLTIYHRGKVVVNDKAVIGDDCSIVHGVTIGNRTPGGGVPRIGNNVKIGAYAQLLGPISVGDGAMIGSLAVVVDDVPAGSTVVSSKARILPANHGAD